MTSAGGGVVAQRVYRDRTNARHTPPSNGLTNFAITPARRRYKTVPAVIREHHRLLWLILRVADTRARRIDSE
jgi:hypothetical protein